MALSAPMARAVLNVSYNIQKLELQMNRIYQRSLMQTEKSQAEGKQMMPETRFT